jgi:WhiB family redox-sensing transcriptional regulator
MAVIDNRADWWALAACQSADPELFFPISEHGRGAEQARRAKLVCAACPVERPCLDYALAAVGLHGIWGGTTETERQLIRRRSARVSGPAAGALPAPAT